MLLVFLRDLFDEGRVAVSEQSTFTDDDLDRCRAWLLDQERVYRTHLPAGMPDFMVDAALDAAQVLYRGCQFLLYRAFDASVVEQGLPLPTADASAAMHYSVDLVLRFLPDLSRLARAASPNDPLVLRLIELGRCWPLSSVGMPKTADTSLEVLQSHPGLWQLYLDRIIARGDGDRLADPRVRKAVDVQAGLFPELARTSEGQVRS